METNQKNAERLQSNSVYARPKKTNQKFLLRKMVQFSSEHWKTQKPAKSAQDIYLTKNKKLLRQEFMKLI